MGLFVAGFASCLACFVLVGFWKDRAEMVGRLRLFWNFCPACNCDAPQCDTCNICNGQRDRYAGIADYWRTRWHSDLAVCRIIDLSDRLTQRDAGQVAGYFDSLAECLKSRMIS